MPDAVSSHGHKRIPIVYSPRTLNEALALFVPNPHAQIYAGGTAVQTDSILTTLKVPQFAISLHALEEIKRVVYGDRILDLGAGLPLNQILHVGKTFLTPALKQAVLTVGNSALRNLATLGGNLCQKSTLGDLFPVLHLLGAQFEIRSQRTSRWVSALQVGEEGKIGLGLGEILARIRIPQEEWPTYFYHKIGNFRTPWDERLSMVCLARVRNGLLEAFRLAYHLPHSGILRDRSLEAELVGQKLPLPAKDRQNALEAIDRGLSELHVPASVFQRDRVLHMTRWILTQLQED